MRMKPTLNEQICPCCGQLVKLYKLDRRSPETYVHLNDLFVKGDTSGDFAKLRYWKLIEQKPSDGEQAGRTSGFWRITEHGREFVEGKLLVKRYVWLFNSTVYGFSGDRQSIQDRLGKKFDYADLMKGQLE